MHHWSRSALCVWRADVVKGEYWESTSELIAHIDGSGRKSKLTEEAERLLIRTTKINGSMTRKELIFDLGVSELRRV